MDDMKIVTGDMVIQDLTPKTTNMGDRLVKNMRICGSGIYTYHKREAPLLGLSPIPSKYRDLEYINVYRPPEVLEANKDKFARVPIITGHHVLVNRDTAKELMVGMVGDTVKSEIDKDDGELYLYTTGTIVAGDGADAYEKYGQLSVGYDPTMEWRDGEHNGVPYQAVLTGFNDINHLLICERARGGPQCMVMDSIDQYSPLERFIYDNGGNGMGVFNKIFGRTKKQAVNGDAKVVSVLLQSIVAGADAKTQVEQIRSIAGDSDDTFNGYLDELVAGCTSTESKDNIAKAVSIVDKYYQEVHGDAEPEPEPSKDDKKEPGDECTCGKADCPVCSKKGSAGDTAKPDAHTPDAHQVNGDSFGDEFWGKMQGMIDASIAKAMPKVEPEKKVEVPPEGTGTSIGGDAADNSHDSTYFMSALLGCGGN